MNIKRVDSFSEKGNHNTNEDVFAYTSNRYWVIDGVTDKSKHKYYSSEDSDASFFAKSFSDMLTHESTNTVNASNEEVLGSAMRKLRNAIYKKELYDINDKLQPCFTIAIILLNDSFIEISILSDCFVYLFLKDNQLICLTYDRIKCISDRTDALKSELLAKKIPIDEAKRLVQEQKIRNRELMNTPNGYWVGSIDGRAFNNMINFREEITKIKSIMICNDGFNNVFKNNPQRVIDILTDKLSMREAYNRYLESE